MKDYLAAEIRNKISSPINFNLFSGNFDDVYDLIDSELEVSNLNEVFRRILQGKSQIRNLGVDLPLSFGDITSTTNRTMVVAMDPKRNNKRGIIKMKPKRKYAGPGSVGKQLRVLFSAWPDYMEKEMQWVQSRKEVYVPEYSALIRNRVSTKELKALLESGKDIMIYDLDGPKLADGTPTTLEVTLDVLRNKINATDFPFGHGCVLRVC
jgi:hypothetical protein